MLRTPTPTRGVDFTFKKKKKKRDERRRRGGDERRAKDAKDVERRLICIKCIVFFVSNAFE
jgi:hypothetical protein